MSRLRLAVIGAGHLGRIHARLAATIDEIELVGVIDPVAAARESVAAEVGTAPFADYRDIAAQLDAVVVAAPTGLHHRIGLDLFAHGLHVLMEKPIATTTAAADELVAAAQAAGCILQVGHVERFNPAWEAGTVDCGEPRYIDGMRATSYTFRCTDVGVVLDLMIHDIDLTLSLIDSPVVSVTAIGAPVIGPHEDMAQARLTFANGAVANLAASRVSSTPRRAMQIYTPGGYREIDFNAHTVHSVTPGQRLLAGDTDWHALPADEKAALRDRFFTEVLTCSTVDIPRGNAILAELQDFHRAVTTGTAPRVSGAAGRNALAVAEQIVQQIAATAGDTLAPHILPAAAQLDGPHWGKSPVAGPQRRAG